MDAWLVGPEHPTTARTERVARELLKLVESHLPQRFYAGEAYHREFCAAAIVRMADTVEAILALMAADFPDDGLVLIRAFYEMVVRFMWVSIDPAGNIVHWGNEARRQVLKMHREVEQRGHTLMNERQVKEATTAGRRMPDVAQFAEEVDKHWGGQMVGFSELPIDGGEGMLSMRAMYTFVYRPGSAIVHMQPETLLRYSTWDPENPPSVVDRPAKGEHSPWWPIVVPLYAHALIACHAQLKWPDPERVRAINNSLYE
ncbi:MAG: DUF5677 domain-containing protein [Solirubrobacteraceae bacterium]